MRLSGSEIQQATQGQWRGDVPEAIHGIATDTRNFTGGQAFLALRGPHFDGHTFAARLADQAEALIGDHEGVRLWENLGGYQLEVADTLKAMGDIASIWRRNLQHTTVVAISGSYGKTSLRSLLEHGFGKLGLHVSATKANLNNLVGVPQTLLSITPDADIALVECGISEIGEMQRLAAMVQPDIAVLTGLTAAHSEGLGGLEGVAREKSQLLTALAPNGWCALGEGVKQQLLAFGIEPPARCLTMGNTADCGVSWKLDGTHLTLSHAGTSVQIELALPARHWAANMALAASIILQHQHATTLAEVAQALFGWQPVAGRMRLIRGANRSIILDDSYNANPVSMQAALDTLSAMSGHRIAILGDMAELGEDSLHAHTGIDLNGIEQVFLVGSKIQTLAEKHPIAHCFASIDEAMRFFRSFQPEAKDIILVKASRSMQLDKIVGLLEATQEGTTHAV